MRQGALAVRRRAGAPADGGFSLVDVLVSMGIMSVVMVVFTTGVLQMYRSTNKQESISTAQQQLSLAFSRLDKEIRYASGISSPGRVTGGNWYVEFQTTNTGTPKCTQLRLHAATAQLQSRTWNQGGEASTWTVLASAVTASQPFERIVADANAAAEYQRLRLRLTSSAGAGGTATTTNIDVTFTALNTTRNTSSENVCNEKGRPTS